MDFTTLDWLRQHHPAWRLLTSPHAALIASFLQRVFILPNERVITQADLAEALEDELFALRETLGSDAFPKSASDYLNDWAGSDKGWLRKFYRQGSDEAFFDLTPATEKAIAWLNGLTARSFVGTESRLLTLFELLRQIDAGSETDPAVRIAELERRRDQIDAEIARVRDGDLQLLDDTALKERFQQFIELSRALLSDFREVEQNFRTLDRWVRERITLWEGSKGELLEAIMGERDAITDSDQGRSFRGFWDFLMSSARQAEFSDLLERILALSAVAELAPDARTRRIHYDWLEAGEHTQRTVAQLSQQLRRFLDDKAWLENRRIMEILRGIEGKALAIQQAPPGGDFMAIGDIGATIELPMERPLYRPAVRPRLTDRILDAAGLDVDTDALYATVVVNSAELARHIRHTLQRNDQVTLADDVLEAGPIEQFLGLSMMCMDARMSRAQDAQERPTYRIAVGPQQGRKVLTLQTLPGCEEPFDAGVGKVAGFSLHAGVAARADQRQKLERLCPYISRPAISEKRLSLTPNGNVRYDVNGFTSVAGAWMRKSDPAEDAVPRWHDACHLTPGIQPSARRASLRLFKIAPGDLVGIDIDKSAGKPICTAEGCREAAGYREVPDEHARPAAGRCGSLPVLKTLR